MVRQQFRLGLDDFGEPACKHFGYALVQFTLPCVQDRLIGRVANERMLEDVARLWQRAALSQQIGLNQPLKVRQQRRLRHRRYRLDQFVRKLSADDRCREHNVLGRAEAIQTRDQRVLQRRRNGEFSN